MLKFAAGGKKDFNLSLNSVESVASSRPDFSAASVANIPGPPAFVIIAILFPSGIGIKLKAKAMSNNSCASSALITPAFSNATL